MNSHAIKLNGKKHGHNWKGEKVGYNGLHYWLINTYGNPKFCEKCKIIGRKTGRKWGIEWALIRGKNYQRNREYFWGLCAKCHRNYDGMKPNKTSFKKGQPSPRKGISSGKWTKEYERQYLRNYYKKNREKIRKQQAEYLKNLKYKNE